MLLKIALLSVLGAGEGVAGEVASDAPVAAEGVVSTGSPEGAPADASSEGHVIHAQVLDSSEYGPPAPNAERLALQSTDAAVSTPAATAVSSRDGRLIRWPKWFGDIPHLGVALDVGVPDGISVNGIFRPWYFARASVGYANNGISSGIKGGLTFVPFNFYVTPALQLEMGHFFKGDGALLQGFGVELPEELKDAFTYTYYTGSIGLEMGTQKRFLFSLRAGLSRVNATVGGLQRTLRAQAGSDTLEVDDPKLRAGIPSAKLGFALFFL